MLPVDLVLVRHGESEGNVANRASREGDNSFFTPEFRNRHSRDFRLSDTGVEQARAASEWIRQHIPMPFDRFYVSDYIRAKETAALLELPHARWRTEYHLRERDKALMDNCPQDEQNSLFQQEQAQYKLDPFLAYPAGGGENIPLHALRLRASYLSHLGRECSDKRVVTVCHGHVMRTLQLELEKLGHDDFIRLDSSEDLSDKIRNCQILWYTRRDPKTNKVEHEHFFARRSICPWDPGGDYGWHVIERKYLSDEELLTEVNRYPRHIKT